MEPRPVLDEVPDHFPLVNGTPIPEQDHLSAEMPQEMTEEVDDLDPGDVGGVELYIQPQAPIGRGDREAGDGGNPVALIAVAQKRGVAPGRPGLAHVRDEQKPAFVEERQMGPTSLGVFLYGAR